MKALSITIKKIQPMLKGFFADRQGKNYYASNVGTYELWEEELMRGIRIAHLKKICYMDTQTENLFFFHQV